MPDFLIMAVSKLYGLVGRDIGYSFSRDYFTQKFAAANIDDTAYVNFDIDDISNFREIISQNPNLRGLNVTIPYKESVIRYLDQLSGPASQIGAVNTVKIHPNGMLEGFNT